MSETPVEQPAAATPEVPSDDGDAELELSPEEQQLPKGVQNRKAFVRMIRRRLRRQRDAVIFLTGERGVGKSMLSIQLGKEICERFEIPKDVLFDPSLQRLYELVFDSKPHSAFVIDECIRIAFSRQAMTARNQQLVELVALTRYKFHCLLMNIPLFANADSSLRGMATFWIHIPARGYAVIFAPSKDPFSRDPFSFRVSSEIIAKNIGDTHLATARLNDLLDAFRECPSFVGWFTFDDLPEADKAVYNANKKPYELRQTLEEKKEQRREDRRLSTSSDYTPGKRKSKRDYVV